METRPIRVLLAINTLGRGGAERQLVELATGLDRERFCVSVSCVAAGGPLVDELQSAGIPVAIFDSRRPLELLGLIKHIRRVAPDIVHGFLFGSNIVGALAATVARVPVVITSRRSLGFFKDGRPHYDLLQGFANWFTDVVVANADVVREDTLRREGLRPAKVHVIRSGVDLDRFDHLPPAAAKRDELLAHDDSAGALVVVVANLIPYKGLACFIDAWREVINGSPAARAVVVGEGPARADLEARAADIAQTIRFIGSRDDVPGILAAADLVVQASFYEGLPNAVLEAMAASRPVVATAVGGTGELVVNGETGLLVPERDSRALASAITTILSSPELASAYGRAARERVEANFTRSQMVARYMELYMSLADPFSRTNIAARGRSPDSS